MHAKQRNKSASLCKQTLLTQSRLGRAKTKVLFLALENMEAPSSPFQDDCCVVSLCENDLEKQLRSIRILL